MQFDLALSQECDYTIFNEFDKVSYIESKDIGQYKFPSAGDWYIGQSNIRLNFDKEELEGSARESLSHNISTIVGYKWTGEYTENSSKSGISSSERLDRITSQMTREHLQHIKFIYIKDAERFRANAYRCKSEHVQAKLEAVENIKIKLAKYDQAISAEKFQKAFNLICDIYLESFFSNDSLRLDIEDKITNFIQELEFLPDSVLETQIYSPNEFVRDKIKIKCYFGEIPLRKFKIKAEVVTGRLEAGEWIELKRHVTTKDNGEFNLDPFLILSANSPQIKLMPDIKIEEDYPQKLEDELHSLIDDNINNNYKIKVDKYLRIDLDKIDIREGQYLITDRDKFIANFKNSIRSLDDWYKSDEKGSGISIELYNSEDNTTINCFIILDNQGDNQDIHLEVNFRTNTTPDKKEISDWLTKLRNQYKKELFSSEITYRLDNNVILEWTDDNGSGKKYYNVSDNGRDTIEVSRGNVRIRYLLQDKLFSKPCFRDTQFVVSEPFIELNNGLKIEFNQKDSPYPYYYNEIKGRAEFKWDGEEQDNVAYRGIFYGLNDKFHTLRVQKNGYLVNMTYDNKSSKNKITVPPNYQSVILPPIEIQLTAIEKDKFNYIKYFSIPGYGQNSLYKTSAIRKIESGLLFLGTIGLLYAQKEYYNNIQLHSNNKINCLVEYNSLPDGTPPEDYTTKRTCVDENYAKENDYINKFNNNISYIGGLYLLNFMDIVISWNFDIE